MITGTTHLNLLHSLPIILLLFVTKFLGAQCPPGDVTLINQFQVNNFAIEYPNCTQISGNLVIGVLTGTANITNLSPLSQIEIITGNFTIQRTNLANFSGMSSLAQIGGRMEIFNNSLLSTFTGLESLVETGDLEVRSNAVLNSFTGLSSLGEIGGELRLYDNVSLVSFDGLNSLTNIENATTIQLSHNLTSFEGLNSLAHIGGNLLITNNNGLTSMQGFESLISIGGYLHFESNPMLNNLLGLSSLTSIGGYLRISFCNALTTLNGLHNIDPTTIANLFINASSNLTYCRIPNICEYLSNPSNPSNINNQPSIGCASKPDVLFACSFDSPPLCTVLTFPENEAQNVPSTITLSWDLADATGYKIRIGTTPGGGEIVNLLNLGDVTSYIHPGGYSPGTTFYVTIIPYNPMGDAQDCTESTFTTDLCTTFTWNGPSGNWSDPSRWTPNGVPGICDNVIINVGQVTLDADQEVANLTMSSSGSGLFGNGNLNIHGEFHWSGHASAISGSGTFHVLGNAYINNLQGQIKQIIGGKQVHFHQSAIMSGGADFRIEAESSIIVETGAVFTINNDNILYIRSVGINTGNGNFINNGTIIKNGSGDVQIYALHAASGRIVRFINNGELILNSAEFSFDNRSQTITHTGSFQVNAGASLIVAGLNEFDSATFIGEGSFALNGTISFLQQITFPNLELLGGTISSATNINISGNLTMNSTNNFLFLTNTGNLVIGGDLYWNAGKIMGSGSVLVGGDITIGGLFSKELSAKSLIVENGLNWISGNLLITTSGLFEISSSAIVNLTNNSSVSLSKNFASSINNHGVVNKNGSGNFIVSFNINSGTINVFEGSLQIDGGTHNGSFNVETSSKIIFGSSVTLILPAATLNGSGSVEIRFGNLNLQANWTFPSLYIYHSTLTGTGSASVAGNLIFEGGSLKLPSAVFHVFGDFSWINGKIEGNGQHQVMNFIVHGNTTIESSGSKSIHNAELQFLGNCDFVDSEALLFIEIARIIIGENSLFTIDSEINFNWQVSGSANAELINHGTIIKNGNGDWNFTGSLSSIIKLIHNGSIEGKGVFRFIQDIALPAHTIQMNGGLAPGPGIGMLEFEIPQTTVFNASSSVEIDVLGVSGPGVGHDQIVFSDAVVLGGTLTVNKTGDFSLGQFNIFKCNSGPNCLSGSFSEIILPDNCSYQQTGNAVLITFGELEAPECTSLISPPDGSQDVPFYTMLEWVPVPLAIGYQISIGTSPGEYNLVENLDVGEVTSFSPLGGLPHGSEIYVKIIPYNSLGYATDCQEENFQTIECTPQTYTFIGGEFSWNNPSAWSPAGIPGSCDNVIINSGKINVTLSSQVKNITQNGGQIFVENGQEFTLRENWVMNAGSFAGAGNVLITSFATLHITTETQKIIGAGSTLINYGTIDWQGGRINTGDNSGINNYGQFLLNGNNDVTTGLSKFKLNNYGVISKLSAQVSSFSSAKEIICNNYGIISCEAGSLFFDSLYNYNTLAFEGGELWIINGILTQSEGASITGFGELRFQASNHIVNTNITIPENLEYRQSGLLSIAENVILTNEGNFFLNTGVIRGPGTFHNSTSGVMNLSNSLGNRFESNIGIQNHGTIQWQIGNIQFFPGNYVLNNFGHFNINASNSFVVNAGALLSFDNQGIITKSSAGITDFPSSLEFINSGIVNLQSGQLRVFGSTLHGGSIHIADEVQLTHFGNVVANNQDGVYYTGAGSLVINTLNILSPVFLNGITLQLSAGNITGVSTLDFSQASTLEWRGGTIKGDLSVNIAEDAFFNIFLTNNKYLEDNVIINNYGLCEWTSGIIFFSENSEAQFINHGTFIAGGEASRVMFGAASGEAMFKNSNTGLLSFESPSAQFGPGVSLQVINEGVMQGTSTISIASELINSGVISPGLSGIGVLTFFGTPNIVSDNGNLLIEVLDGSGPGTGHDQLVCGFDYTLSGSLVVTELDDAPEGFYTIISSSLGAINGSFSNVDLPDGYVLHVNSNNVQIEKTTSTPACTSLTNPINGAQDIPLNSPLSWTAIPGVSGYLLNIGTTQAGTDILNMQDVGNVITYNHPGGYPSASTIYVTITPYVGDDNAENCPEQSFSTISCTSVSYNWNGSNSSWSNAAAWSPVGVPGACDIVVITGGTVAVDIPVTVATLNFAGGTLNGTNTLDIADQFNWTGGTINGSVTLNIASSAVMNMSAGNKFIAQNATINLHGTANWTAGNLQFNAGSAIINNFGTFSISAAVNIFFNGGAGSASAFNNKPGATINKSTGITLFSGLFLNSDGNINISSGTLNLANTVLKGHINTESGGILLFSGFRCDLEDGVQFSGNGLVHVTGVMTVSHPIQVTNYTLRLSAGSTVSGSASIQVAESSLLEWAAGTVGGNLTINIEAGGQLNLYTSGVKNLVNNAIINQNGTISWSLGNLVFQDNVQINNSGVLNISGSVGTGGSASTGGIFTNLSQGVINKTGSTTQFSSVITFNNAGVINVNSGSLNLGTSNHTGLVHTVSPASFRFESVANLNEGSLFTGTGQVVVSTGTLNVNHPAYIQGPTLVLGAATISGSSTIFVQEGSSFDWGNGTVTGNVTIDIAQDSWLNMTTNNTRTFTGNAIINHRGSASWTFGTWQFNNNSSAQFNNFGTFTSSTSTKSIFTIGANAASFINKPGAILDILNNTTLVESGANFQFINEGLIQGKGILSTGNGFTNNGTIAPGPSIGSFRVNGQSQPFSSNSTLEIEIQSGSGPGTGHDQFTRDGNLTLSGTLTVTETGTIPLGNYVIINLVSGTINGSFAGVNLPDGYTLQVNANNVQVVKAESLILCTSLISPIHGAGDIAPDANLNWITVEEATGYKLSIGTTPGGTDLLNNQDLGNVTTYSHPVNWPFQTTIYVRVVPYSDAGDAQNCSEESFTTIGCNVITYTWFGGSSNWNNSAAWSPNGVPGPCDHAIINGGITTVSATQQVSRLTLNGGSLGGNNNLDILTEFVWGGGVISGSGTVFSYGNAVLNGNSKSVTTKTVRFYGEITWSSGNLILGFNATVVVMSEAGFTVQVPEGQVLLLNHVADVNSPVAYFSNYGTLTKQGAGRLETYWKTEFNNHGAVSIEEGEIRLAGSNTNQTGSFDIAAGALFNLTGGTNTFNGVSSTGSGYIEVNGGVYNTGQNASTLSNVKLIAGSISGIHDVHITEEFVWEGGTISGNGGTIFIPGHAILQGGNKTITTKTLRFVGTGIWTAGNLIMGFSATVVVMADAGFTVQVPDGQVLLLNHFADVNSPVAYFSNYGTLTKQGAGRLETYWKTEFNNHGAVSIEEGEIRLAGSNTTQTGTFDIATGSLFNLTSGTNTFNGVSSTGLGYIQVNGGVYNTGQNASTLSNVKLITGSISGIHDVHITEEFVWEGGTISGNGGTIFIPGHAILQGGNKTITTKTLRFVGTGIWTAGNLIMGFSATVVVMADAGFTVQVPDGQVLLLNHFADVNSPVAYFSNYGTLTKQGAGRLETYWKTEFNNHEAVSIEEGEIRLAGSNTAQTGSFDIAEAAKLHVTSGNNHLNGVQITGAGYLEISGGNCIMGANESNIERIRHLSGSISGSGNFTIAEEYFWAGGSIFGAGQVNINGPAHFTGGTKTLIQKTLRVNVSGLWDSGNMVIDHSGDNGTLLISQNAVLEINPAANMTITATTSQQFPGVIANYGTLLKTGSGTFSTGFWLHLFNFGVMSGFGQIDLSGVFFEQSGTIAPGNPVGQLSLARATVTFNTSAGMHVELLNNSGPGIGHDQVVFSGNVQLAGTLTAEINPGMPTGSYTILTCNGGANCRSGTFSNLNLPSGATVSYTGNSVAIQYQGIPDCTALTQPANGAVQISPNSLLEWGVVPDATGYMLSAGTTPGGTDLLNLFNAGNVTSYQHPVLWPAGTTVYVVVTPYNAGGPTPGCAESSFTTLPLCPPSHVTLANQNDVNNFAATYPFCTQINGNLTIGLSSGTSNINNISGLSAITTINNYLNISRTLLTNLNGLHNLSVIGGKMTIQNNTQLNSLTHLANLNSITGNLDIAGQSFLTSLSGLDNINPTGITLLRIAGCKNLSYCHLQNICDYLANPSNQSNITGNANGCKTRPEVEEACFPPPACAVWLSPQNGSIQVPVSVPLEWEGSVAVDGYKIRIGTTSGGSEILPLTDLGWEIIYHPNGNWPESVIYVTLIPYVNGVDAIDCQEIHFSTIPAPVCPPGTVILTTQAQVDAFVAQYPNCTNMPASLQIGPNSGSSNITDISGLSFIESVSGNLRVQYNGTLSNMQGLQNITSVGQNLSVSNNPVLLSMQGLSSLNTVGSAFRIENNASLITLNGLESLNSVGGLFYVFTNPQLTSIGGVENLQYVGGNLHMNTNPLLSSLAPLQSVTTVLGDVRIISCNSLQTLWGLQNIDFSTVPKLWLQSSSALYACQLPNICTFLSNGGESSITGNASGCATKIQVQNSCNNICPPGSITLANQTQVNNFAIQYPFCTQINGNLTIGTISGNSNISSLSGVGMLTSVTHNLSIFGLTQVSSLQGLNISSVGGNLIISNNPGLTSLDGLSNISTVTSLEIAGNSLLSSLSGLQSLNSVAGHVFISGGALVSLEGLHNLSHIGGFFMISEMPELISLSALTALSQTGDFIVVHNPKLQSFGNLDSLTSIGGSLDIGHNNLLTSISNLPQLSSISYRVYIENNPVLNDISGLALVNLEGLGNGLHLHSNPLLSYCHLDNICAYLADPSNLATISGNDQGCSSVNQIIAVCTGCPAGDIILSTQAEVDQFVQNYPNCTQVNGSLSIGQSTGSSNISDISGLSNLTHVAGHLIIFGIAHLSDLQGLNITSVGGDVRIRNNPGLTSIAGLNLSTIGGTLNISQNTVLSTLAGLENITSLLNLTIAANPGLQSLHGLNNLTLIYGDINIGINNSLFSLSGLESLEYVNGRVTLRTGRFSDLQGLNQLAYIGGILDVSDNYFLNSLNGLSSLTYIGTSLYISHNAVLQNLDGLQQISFIGSELAIFLNPVLTDLSGLQGLVNFPGFVSISGNLTLQRLDGLEHMGTNNLTNLYIAGNPELVFCNLDNICAYLANPANDASISGNANGCMSRSQISGICANPCPPGNVILANQSQVNQHVADYPCCEHINGELRIGHNTQQTNVNNVSGLKFVKSVAADLRISRTNLSSLNGLGSLQSTGGMLEISNNSILGSITSLQNLQSVNGLLLVNNNSILQSLSGLENINPAGISHLFVNVSSSLNYCHLPNLCTYLSDPSNPATINGNAAGCASRSVVLAHCGIEETLACTQVNTPQTGTANVSILQSLHWNSVENADGYKVFAGTMPGLNDLLDDFDVGLDTFYLPDYNYYPDQTAFMPSGHWPPETTIYVRIAPYSQTDQRNDCALTSFTTGNGCTQVTYPADAAIDVSVNEAIQWTGIPGFHGYRLFVGTTPGGSEVINGFYLGNVTQYTPANGWLPNTTHYVRVAPHVGEFEASACTETSFTTISCTASAWFYDYDGDGYGSGEPTMSCFQPSGFVLLSGDCDDTNPDIHPGAEEICNGLDDDCNGLEDDLESIPALPWVSQAFGNNYNGTGVELECSPYPLSFKNISTTNLSPYNPYGNLNFRAVNQTLCNNTNVTISGRLDELAGFGWGGIFIGIDVPQKRYVAIKSKLSGFTVVQMQNTSFTHSIFNGNHNWFKIQRTSNIFRMYLSVDGVTWTQVQQYVIPMGACVRVGVFSESINPTDTTSTVFSHVDLIVPAGKPGDPVVVIPEPVLTEADVFKVYPNPFNGELYIGSSLHSDDPVEYRLLNSLGQAILISEGPPSERHVQHTSHLPVGFYSLQVWSEGKILGIYKVLKR